MNTIARYTEVGQYSAWAFYQTVAPDCPVYQRMVPQSFEEIRLTSKSDLRRRFCEHLSLLACAGARDMLVAEVLRSMSLPIGCVPAEYAHGAFVIERSSGTTGPVTFYPRAKWERSVMAVILARERRAAVREYTSTRFFDVTAGWEAVRGLPGESKDTYAEKLAHLVASGRVNYLYGRRSGLEYLAEQLDGIKLDRTIAIELAGEYLTDLNTTAVRRVFGGPILNQYGCRESWAIGYADGLSSSFKLIPEVYVELVDDGDEVIRTEGRVGRIVVTSLVWRVFPTIRFVTGDMGYWEESPRGLLLHLEHERECEQLHVGGGIASGTAMVKRVLNDIRRCGEAEPLEAVKVRKRGTVIYWYLHPADWQCKKAIADQMSKLSHINSLRLEFLEWQGWTYGEKQLLFVEECGDAKMSN